MGKHELFRAVALRRRPEVRGRALAVKGIRIHVAAHPRSHDRMNRRMHDDVSAFGQLFHLIRR